MTDDATDGPDDGPLSVLLATLARRVPSDRTFRAVVAITVLALAARLFRLGARVAHWDEGRVAFWTLRYAEAGYFQYRAIVHGPFLFQVDRLLFLLFGPSDFVARLPVAVVGGVLPLVAWSLRDRLRDAEVVALAALLAANPLLLYYSRFARNDVLIAAFCTFALAAFVRAYDTRRPRYVYAGAAFLALGFTTKENVVLYLLCWGGALLLLLDHRLLDAVRSSPDSRRSHPHDGASIRAAVRSLAPSRALSAVAFLASAPPVVGLFDHEGLAAAALVAVGTVGYALLVRDPSRRIAVFPLALVVAALPTGLALPVGGAAVWHVLAWLLAGLLVADDRLFDAGDPVTSVPPALGASLLFLVVVVFFYAPRAGPTDGIGLWRAVGDPTLFPAVLEEALVGSWEEFRATWGPADPFSEERLSRYPGRLENMLGTVRTTAAVTVVFAALGFFLDRWSADGPRDLVAFAGYWGVAAAFGYPYATDIWAPWVAVHAVVPLALPAAVGLGAVYRVGVRAWTAPDRASLPSERTAEAATTDGGRDDRGGPLTRLVSLGRPVALGAAVVLVAVAVPMAVTAVDVGYVNSDGHERLLSGSNEQNQYALQWGQPANDLKDRLATVRRISAANDGTDVLFVGGVSPFDTPVFFMPAEEVCQRTPPVHRPLEQCDDPDRGSWHSRLPLPWYLEAYDARVDSTPPEADLSTRESFPPVVIAYDFDRDRVASALPESYEASTHRFKLWGERIVVFVDRSSVPDR